jgi:hypothetical protein
MKIFLFATVLTALTTATAGLALAGGGFNGQKYSACAHSNSKECQDAKKAFADHHNGMFPEQYYNQWYQGHQGRWDQHGKDWRWENEDGGQYRKVHDKWEWVEHHKHHHDNH